MGRRVDRSLSPLDIFFDVVIETADELHDSVFNGWYYGWMVTCIFSFLLCRILVGFLRTRSHRGLNAVLCFFFMMSLFPLLFVLELGFLLQAVRSGPKHDFGFTMTVIVPTVMFWLTAVFFIIDVIYSLVEFWLRPKFVPFHVIDNLMPGHWCFPVAELAFACAYCSRVGIVYACLRGCLVMYENQYCKNRRKRIPASFKDW